MKRDLAALASVPFDLVVVGGGINGAWAAWDATLRGLSVALIDKGDFGGATSANSFKIIHGGLRYLQQLDLRRMRESIRERRAVARVAPGLVRPLPFLVPTQGTGSQSRTALRVALAATDLIGFDRNRDLDPRYRIPRGRLLSREECLARFPYFDRGGLSGGALWYDLQLLDPERFLFAILRSAAERGAMLANYVRAERVGAGKGQLHTLAVCDEVTGDTLALHARAVVVASGPWSGPVGTDPAGRDTPSPALAVGVNLVVRRQFAEVAAGLRLQVPSQLDPVGGGRRYLFLTPWRSSTLIGTAYREFSGDPDRLHLQAGDLEWLVNACNTASPALELSMADVTAFHAGLLPLRRGRQPGRSDALADGDLVTAVSSPAGPGGVVRISGVKYTTARRVAQLAVDRVFALLRRPSPPCRTDCEPLRAAPALDPLAGGEALRRRVVDAVRQEMAITLGDIVFRRTALGTERLPAPHQLEEVAGMAGAELGWSEVRQAEEVQQVIAGFGPLHPHPVPTGASSV